MNLDTSLSTLSVAGLAHRCRQETERFYRRLRYDERFCFELFRRAILQCSEQAWDLIVEQYTRQVTTWVTRHEAFAAVNEPSDYFVNHAFAKFWRAFSRDPLKLNRFESLRALMQYLKLCAHSALKEYVQRHMSRDEEWDSETAAPHHGSAPDPATEMASDLAAQRLWQRVLKVVKTDQERIIAEAYFVYDMKPREIFSWRQDAFDDVVQVRRVKDNFLARLRRDKQLLAILQEHG
jgi:predicted nucleic acid-binding protein